MKIKYRKKCQILAVLFAAFASTVTVQADTPKKKSLRQRTEFTTLSLNLETLKELGGQFQGPKNVPLSKLIDEVIDKAQEVVNQGDHASPPEVTKSLHSVEKLLDYLKMKEIRIEDRQSSLSSIQIGCDVCSELHHLEKEVRNCCTEIKTELYDLLTYLQKQFPCDAPKPISCVPYTISEPGKYCVTCDLVYDGSHAAITVAADNVTLNFQNHDLTLTNPNAEGVLAQNVSEFTLLNDIIQGAQLFKTATSAAVHLVNVNKALITNIYTKNTTKGVKIENSTDVRIEYSLIEAHEGVSAPTTAAIGAGVWVESSEQITVDACTFTGAPLNSPLPTAEASNAILVQGDSKEVIVKNSSFENWLSTITLNKVTTAVIENCMLDASSLSTSNLLEVGSMTDEATDITIRNSTFKQSTLVPGFDGILFLNGSGCLMENVIVDVKTENDGEVDPFYPGAVHIGCAVNGHVSCDPYLSYSDILAKNVIIKGTNEYGLFIENGSFITFIDSEFTDASLANVFFGGAVDANHASTFGAYACVVKDSLITLAKGPNGNGVLINPGANKNAVANCEVTHNGHIGIVVSKYGTLNNITGNSVIGNGNVGIEDDEATTATFYNTSCNNAGTNCVNVLPFLAPGFPLVAGTNICCTQ